MFNTTGCLKHFLAGTLLAIAVGTSGCAARITTGYRVHDPYRADDHVWDANEGVFYNQWVIENHRPHRDFRKLNQHDQEEYWKWRHDHSDHR